MILITWVMKSVLHGYKEESGGSHSASLLDALDLRGKKPPHPTGFQNHWDAVPSPPGTDGWTGQM